MRRHAHNRPPAHRAGPGQHGADARALKEIHRNPSQSAHAGHGRQGRLPIMPARTIPRGVGSYVRPTAPKRPEIRGAYSRSLRSRPCVRPGAFRACASRRDLRRLFRAEHPARACSVAPGSPDLATPASSCTDCPVWRWTGLPGAASPITVILGREQCLACRFSPTLDARSDISSLPRKRHVRLENATLSEAVERVAAALQRRPSAAASQ